MIDEYHTVWSDSCTEIKVQGSRFIGEASSADSVESAERKLEQIRKREHAATHHCYAWRIGQGAEMTFKYSDDGEPNGTAGRPIYDVICGADLTDTLVVVTRYFGGTKLGTGGLAHAYSDAARLAIEQAGKVTKYLIARAHLTLEFSAYDRLMRAAQTLGANTVDSQFAENVTLTLEIRRSRLEELRRIFIELTAGKGQIDIPSAPSE
ncbi:MAG: YigZ family protein [candidate division Zixibacteria bacterium]|nr:YigZ family protein [candidate division Zixibacteria bacterium]